MPKQPQGFDKKSNPELIQFAQRVSATAQRVLSKEQLKSQNTLGEALGLTSGDVSKLLRAHHDPRLTKALGIAKALRVSAGWLLAGEGPGEANTAESRARSAAAALDYAPEVIEAGIAKAAGNDNARAVFAAILEAEKEALTPKDRPADGGAKVPPGSVKRHPEAKGVPAVVPAKPATVAAPAESPAKEAQ